MNALINNTNESVKAKIVIELIKDCTTYNLDNNAKLVNFFYNNYIDENKFENSQEYDFLLKSDRFENGFFNVVKSVKWLVENRFDLLDFEFIDLFMN